MVYLNNNTEAQVLFIPKVFAHVATSLSLHLEGTTGSDELTVPVSDLNTSERYYNLAVELPAGMDTGEYEYQLKDGEILLSSGIVILTDAPHPTEEYDKAIEYEQCDG